MVLAYCCVDGEASSEQVLRRASVRTKQRTERTRVEKLRGSFTLRALPRFGTVESVRAP